MQCNELHSLHLQTVKVSFANARTHEGTFATSLALERVPFLQKQQVVDSIIHSPLNLFFVEVIDSQSFALRTAVEDRLELIQTHYFLKEEDTLLQLISRDVYNLILPLKTRQP